MAATAASLQVLVGADISGVLSGFQQVNRTVSNAGSIFRNAAGTALGFTAAALGMNAISGVAQALNGSIFGMNSTLQGAEIAFTTLLGSGEKAAAMLGQIKAFAKTTPFDLPQVLAGAKGLLAFGFAAEQVLPLLTDMGNVSAGLDLGAEGIARMTRALGQMRAKGRVQQEDLNQLQEVGVDTGAVFAILGRNLGKTVPELKKLQEQGRLAPEDFLAAFQEFSKTRFGGLMEKQSKTLVGAMSNIRDAFGQAGAKAFLPFFNAVQEGALRLAAFTDTPAFDAFVTRTTAGVQSMLHPFQVFSTTVQNISRDHGLSIFQAALIATEQQIADTFGPSSAAVFNGFQGAARTAFDWLKTNGPAAFAWMQPSLIEGFMQHFARFGTTVANISEEHGVGKLQSAFITLENDIARIFGEQSADLFNSFGASFTKLADSILVDQQRIAATSGTGFFDFNFGQDIKNLETIAGWLNTIGGTVDKLRAFADRNGGEALRNAPGLADRMGMTSLAPPNAGAATDPDLRDAMRIQMGLPPDSATKGRTVNVNLSISGGFIPTDPEWLVDVIGERIVEVITTTEESALATAGMESQPGN